MIPNNIDFTVIGDTNMDYHVRSPLSINFADLTENGIITWEEIDEIPGGSGLNFCAFAKECGYTALLLSNVGNDMPGMTIKKWLDDAGITTINDFVLDSFGTGKAVIIRDANNIRLLVNNQNHANHRLNFNHVQNHLDQIINSKVIYISGYAISDAVTDRFHTVTKLLKYLNESDVLKRPLLVLDVVPHKIYEKMSFDEFYSLTDSVDVLISEVSTLRRFWGLGTRDETIDESLINETIQVAEKYYKNLILRVGPSGCDEQIVWRAGKGIVEHELTGHAKIKDKRGFGDRIAIKALKEHFLFDAV